MSNSVQVQNFGESTRGIGFAVLAGIIFGSAGIFTRSVSGISPIGIAAGRLLLGFSFMGALVWIQGHTKELKESARSSYPLLLLLGIISSLHFVLFVLAVQKTFIANALILVNTAPIFVLLLAPLFLKESITGTDTVSVGITFLGTGLIVGFDKILLTQEHLIGDMCALGSAFCYALYVILARKLRARYSSPTIMFWFFGLGALFLVFGGKFIGDTLFPDPSMTSWLFLGLLGVLPTGIGHFSYNLSLKYIPAARASTIALLEPVTGTIFALIFLGEIPPITTWIGIVIALLGISIASLSHLRGGLRQT